MPIAFTKSATFRQLSITYLHFLLFCFLAVQLHAQSDSGRIVGNVTEITGGAIPGAVVTLANVENGLQLTGTSNSVGEFNIPSVPRGEYKATVTAAGFEPQSQSFTLTVTQVQTLLFKLQPGSVTTSSRV